MPPKLNGPIVESLTNLPKVVRDRIKHRRRLRSHEIQRQLQAHHDRFKAGTQRAWLARYLEKQMTPVKHWMGRMGRAGLNRKARRAGLSDLRKKGLVSTRYAEASTTLMKHLYGRGIECVVGFNDNQTGALDCQVKEERHLREVPAFWKGLKVDATICTNEAHQFQSE